MKTYSTGVVDETALTAMAARFAEIMAPPLVVWLKGDLGAGKTTWCRALIQGLGYDGRVKSPTYGLLEEYRLEDLTVVHLDLYRINDPEELVFLGIADQVSANTLLLVEWPDQGRGFLPPCDIELAIDYSGNGRKLHFTAHSEHATALLNDFVNKINLFSS